MDSNVTAHVGNLAPRINMWPEKKIGRPRSDYRAARRNAAKAARKLPEWRETVWAAANVRAGRFLRTNGRARQ